MCGRYNITPNANAWIDLFGSIRDLLTDEDWQPRYNIAPSSWVPIIRATAGGESLVADKAQWGFIPHWVKDQKPRIKPINARAEGVASKALFRDSFKHRRCLFVASGFYEWRRENGKQPYNFVSQSGEPLLMAGIWDNWAGDDTAAIITTSANATMVPIHDRMPVIVPANSINEWILGKDYQQLLKPAPDDLLQAHRLSKAEQHYLFGPRKKSP